MKLINLILSILLIIVVVACEKDKQSEELTSIIEDNNSFASLLEKYNLDSSDVRYMDVSLGVDTSQIFFLGIKGDRLRVDGFNKETMSTIVSWEDYIPTDTIIEIEHGYGIGKTKYLINDFGIESIWKLDSIFTFIVWGIGYEYPNSSGNKDILATSQLFFINKEKVLRLNTKNLPDNEFLFEEVIPWINGYFITNDYQFYSRNNQVVMRNPEGNIIFKCNRKPSQKFSKPISLEYYIVFYKNCFKLIDLKSNKEVWESKSIFEFFNLPDNTRIDEVIYLDTQDYDNIKVVIFYTMFSDQKGKYELLININNGELK